MGGSKSKSKGAPVVQPLSETDLRLQDIATAFSGLQLGAFGNVLGLNQGLTGKALEGINTAQFTTDFLQNDPSYQAALQSELNRVQSGGLSPQTADFINRAAAAQLGLAESDINKFASDQRQALIRDLTPSLGLRPTDTPIQDRGFQIGSEATRQLGQAAQGIRGQAFQAALTLPLQQAQANQSLLGLRSQLANQDYQSRLGLAGQAADIGLTAAAPGAIAGTLSAVKTPKVAGQATKSQSAAGSVL